MHIYIYTYNHSQTYDGIKQQRCTIHPPSCDLNAPRGGIIYTYIKMSAGTGNRPRFPSHSCPQLH